MRAQRDMGQRARALRRRWLNTGHPGTFCNLARFRKARFFVDVEPARRENDSWSNQRENGDAAAPAPIAAVVQAAPVAFDLERTLQKAADLTADAARQNAKLVL